MDYNAQLKLQAFLDGELPEAEASEVANWLARDQEAAALLGELRNTRKAVAGFEHGIRLPESREFYWSKIQREIERLEPAAPAPVRESVPVFAWLRRLLVPIAAVGLLVLAGLVAVQQGGAGAPGETSLADSGGFTYHDFTSGATLVWLSYPADNEVADDDEMSSID